MKRMTLIGLALLAPALPGQKTLIVDSKNGPYKTIQAAVDRAVADDIVLVRGAGPYLGARITRGIRLLGESAPVVVSDIVATGIRSGERLALSGMHLRALLKLSQSRGTVHLSRMTITIANSWLPIDDCDHVSIVNSTLTAALRPTRSYVALVGTRVTPRIHTAVALNNARLVVTNSTLAGGDGVCSRHPQRPTACVASPQIGYAIEATNNSTIIVKGTILKTGKQTGSCHFQCFGGYVVWLDRTSRVLRDTDQLLTSGGFGGIRVLQLHDLSATEAKPGGTVPVTIRTRAAAPYAVFAGFGSKPIGTPLAGWVDPASAFVLYADFVKGASTRRIRTPAHLPRGLPVALQAVLLVGNRLELSTPTVVVLD